MTFDDAAGRRATDPGGVSNRPVFRIDFDKNPADGVRSVTRAKPPTVGIHRQRIGMGRINHPVPRLARIVVAAYTDGFDYMGANVTDRGVH